MNTISNINMNDSWVTVGSDNNTLRSGRISLDSSVLASSPVPSLTNILDEMHMGSLHNFMDEGDLIFLDMKIEKAENKYKTIFTYIDKKNYKEVTREFNCNISFNRSNYFTFDNDFQEEIYNIRITRNEEVVETSKDI